MAYSRGISILGSLIGSQFGGGGRRGNALPVAGQTMALSPALRAVLKRRAARGARRIYQPQIQQAEAAKSAIRRAYHQQIQGANATGEQLSGSLGDLAASLADSGLHGQYLQQAREGLAQQQAGAQEYGAYIGSTLQPQKRADLLSANQDIAKAQVAEQQDAARKLYSLISQARTKGLSALGTADGASGPTDREQAQHANTVEWPTALTNIQQIIAEKGLPQSESQWAEVQRLAGGEGVDPTTASKALDYYRNALGARYSVGQAEQAGVNVDPLQEALARILRLTGSRGLTIGGG